MSDEKKRYDLAEIKKAIGVLYEPGQIVEVRMMDKKKKLTAAGWFDDMEIMAKAVARLARDGFGDPKGYKFIHENVFWTCNPVHDALLARQAKNTISFVDAATSDQNVLRRRWIPVDIDPLRPSGVSATDEEKQAAKEVTNELIVKLGEVGFPDSCLVGGRSGNGYHLLIRCELPNDSESLALVKHCLEAMQAMVGNDNVEIDRSVCNAARIIKCYGTLACKGIDHEKRPWRMAKLLTVPKKIEPCSRELLEKLAALSPEKRAKKPVSEKSQGSWNEENTQAYLDWTEWDWQQPIDYEGGRKWVGTCPNNSEHKDSAVILNPDGWWNFTCFHATCKGFSKDDFKQFFEEKNGEEYRYPKSKHRAIGTSSFDVEDGPEEDANSPESKSVALGHKHESLVALRTRIDELQYASRKDRDDLPPVKKAPDVITNLIWRCLNKNFKIFKSDTKAFIYLHIPEQFIHSKLPRVIPVDADDERWSYFMDKYFGIQKVASLYDRVTTQIYIRGRREKPSCPVHEQGMLDEKTGTLYVCFSDDIIKIAPFSPLEIVPNGTDGLYFIPHQLSQDYLLDPKTLINSHNDPLSFLQDPTPFDELESELARFLFDGVPLDPTRQLSPEQMKKIIIAGFLTTFFSNAVGEKPIFYFMGDHDTGKTHLLRKLIYLIFGIKYEVTSMGIDPKDFTNALVNNYFLALDDVQDAEHANSTQNAKKLTQCATGGYVKQRVFYTNAQEVNLPFTAWPWISGLQPFDKSPDFLSRVIPIHFRGEVQGNRMGRRELQKYVLQNRESLLADVLRRLQDMVNGNWANREGEYRVPFRMTDWSKIVLRAAEAQDRLDEWMTIFDTLKDIKIAESEQETLVSAIKLWVIEKQNNGRTLEKDIWFREVQKIAGRERIPIKCLTGSKASYNYFCNCVGKIAKSRLRPELGFEENSKDRTVRLGVSLDQMNAIRRWAVEYLHGSESPALAEMID